MQGMIPLLTMASEGGLLLQLRDHGTLATLAPALRTCLSAVQLPPLRVESIAEG